MKPNLTSRLERADLVAPLGYGAGFPVLLPWGQQVVNRLIGLFRHSLWGVAPGKWCEWEPELLVDRATYEAQVAGVGGFDNVYPLEYGGRSWVLRPDAAVDGLQRALSHAGPSHDGAAFSVYTAYRDLKGSCTPMWRDRAIWPVMQLDVVSPSRRVQSVGEAVASGLDRFFKTLGLPVLRVDMGPWKEYARRRLDWVLATDRAAPTVLAMAYTVGDFYRSLLEIPEDCEAFDVGLTAKPLATLVGLVGDGDRLVLPRAIAPVEVVVAASQEPNILSVPSEVRVARVDSRTKGWERRWADRGVPVLLHLDAAGRARQLVGSRSWEPLESGTTLDALVEETSGNAPPAEPPYAGDDLPRFAVLCDSCAARRVLHANVQPVVNKPCDHCGQHGTLRLTADVDQIY